MFKKIIVGALAVSAALTQVGFILHRQWLEDTEKSTMQP